jgi:hypothetical protein
MRVGSRLSCLRSHSFVGVMSNAMEYKSDVAVVLRRQKIGFGGRERVSGNGSGCVRRDFSIHDTSR